MIIGGIWGAISTFILQIYGVSAVVASCLIGLTGALLGHFLKLPHLPLIIFAGSFVGMTSLSIGNIPLIVGAGALCGILYTYSLNIFAGFGGRLGTIAFISTTIMFFVFKINQRTPITKIKR